MTPAPAVQPVTIKRFHWLSNTTKRTTPHIAIRCPQCELTSRTGQLELPDENGRLDFCCRSVMDLCQWQGVVILDGWRQFQADKAARQSDVCSAG